MGDTHNGHNGVLVASLVVREINRGVEHVQTPLHKMGDRVAPDLEALRRHNSVEIHVQIVRMILSIIVKLIRH